MTTTETSDKSLLLGDCALVVAQVEARLAGTMSWHC